MIIGGSKKEVIENIEQAIKEGNYNKKVEVGDPKLSNIEKQEITEKYLKEKNGIKYFINNKIARGITEVATYSQNKSTKILGIDKLKGITTGAIITSNHFNPVDNTVIRKLAKKMGKKRLYVVGQESNLAMKGIVGFLMNYMDIIPISDLTSYMKKAFPNEIKEKLDKNQFILIYPEEEMWFNYKKPRTPKQGAYYYAAKFNVPIISCFTQITSKDQKDNDEFYKVEYTLHVLDPIYPDKGKNIKENTAIMMEKDFMQKKDAYEKAYGEKLDYKFKKEDIVGLV